MGRFRHSPCSASGRNFVDCKCAGRRVEDTTVVNSREVSESPFLAAAISLRYYQAFCDRWRSLCVSADRSVSDPRQYASRASTLAVLARKNERGREVRTLMLDAYIICKITPLRSPPLADWTTHKSADSTLHASHGLTRRVVCSRLTHDSFESFYVPMDI
jgi:hypothetical protein